MEQGKSAKSGQTSDSRENSLGGDNLKAEEKAAPPQTQTEQDHIERLRAMESDHGETWDLSPNDQAAIRWARYQAEVNKELLEALEYVRGTYPEDTWTMTEMDAWCDKLDTLIAKARGR